MEFSAIDIFKLPVEKFSNKQRNFHNAVWFPEKHLKAVFILHSSSYRYLSWTNAWIASLV